MTRPTSSSSAPASPASARPSGWPTPGLKVVVVEEAPRLGGRATAFADRETGERVDNGQHVLFGCYRETYAFLARIGTAGLAPLDRRLDVDDDGRGRAADTCWRVRRWPPPWHLVGRRAEMARAAARAIG